MIVPSLLASVDVLHRYQAQVTLITSLLRPLHGPHLEIGTVDGMQGREKEAVVISLVRSNENVCTLNSTFPHCLTVCVRTEGGGLSQGKAKVKWSASNHHFSNECWLIRLAVAMTRARRHLVRYIVGVHASSANWVILLITQCIVGDSSTVRHGGPFLERWMSWLEVNADVRYAGV
jgi:DNA polymerase alpha-associated DNA helicase A